MNPQLQAKWMEQEWGGGGEVVKCPKTGALGP